MREPGYYWVRIKGYKKPLILRHFHEQGKGYWQDNYKESEFTYIGNASIALPLDMLEVCDRCYGQGEVFFGVLCECKKKG